MSLSPNFSIHLHGRPFRAQAYDLNEDCCVLSIGDGPMEAVTIFLPADRIEQVQRIADALNEIGLPTPANSDIAA